MKCPNSYPSVFKELLWMMMLWAGRVSCSSQSRMDPVEASYCRLLLYNSLMTE